MERRDILKQALAVGISIILVLLIFFILVSPPTVIAVRLSPGSLSTSDKSPDLGDVITFRNVNLTIEALEAIPVNYLNFSIKKTSDDSFVTHVRFYINGTELPNGDPTNKFEIIDTTWVSGIPYNGSSGYGYDWNDATGYSFDYGYGYRNSSNILTILYNITFDTDNLVEGTSYYAMFYVVSDDGTTNHTYSSDPDSHDDTTFTIQESASDSDDDGGGGVSTTTFTADAGGPYTGTKGSAVQFSGSVSGGTSPYTYEWAFGDGGTSSVASPSHTYTTSGSFTATLTVTDSVGASDSDTASVTISEPTQEIVSDETLENISETYDVTLTESFNATDTDGDGVVDTLNDPNGVLTQVQTGTTINGNAAILISTDGDDIPEFFWDTETNEITEVTHTTGTVSESETDTENETITYTVTIEKTDDWIYIDITDIYPEETYSDYTVTINAVENGVTRTISSDKIWRESGRIYILDDPPTEYEIIYSYTVLDPTFDPDTTEIINQTKPTIIVTYKESVIINSIIFTLDNNAIEYIYTNLSDNTTFTFIPVYNLSDGTLKLTLDVSDNDGNNNVKTAQYTVQLPTIEPTPEPEEEKEKDEIPWLLIAVVIIILIILFLVYLFKIGYLYVEYEEPEKTEFEKVDEFEKIEEKKTPKKTPPKKGTGKKGKGKKGSKKK